MARSIVSQNLLLQAEVTPGTAVTNAMKRYLSIKGDIGWDIQRDYLKAAGSKVNTALVTNQELGTMNLEVMQDYNAILPILSGVFGKPVTTVVEAGKAWQHVFTLNPFAADLLQTFTLVWGDATQALQAVFAAFQSLNLTIDRTGLGLSTSGIMRAPTTIAYPGAGVTSVPMVPVRASTYCAYLDTTWAALGTSKLLALYNSQLQIGDKFQADWVVDCAKPSYSELIENDGMNATQSLQLGFDATAATQVTDAMDGKLKFVRIESTGAQIEGALATNKYKLTIDSCLSLTPGGTGRASASPAVVVNFDGQLMVDPVSNNVIKITVINGLSGI